MSLPELLNQWQSDPILRANVATWHTLPARAARRVDFPADVHPHLRAALQQRGITQLYTHQRSAWRAVQQGQHVVVVTGTASGKTWCYNLPTFDALLRNAHTRALYLFPTKALAQDQADEAQGFLNLMPMQDWTLNAHLQSPIATYDGDTPTDRRAAIRTGAHIVITNPDMLHTGILPHHTLWATFLKNLRFVVIDELHTLRGVFGSHVANVLRRLRRIARFYGATPQFILASATIANPIELAERMVEAPVTLIDDDGAPHGAKHFVIYNPPIVNADLGLRRSALLEAVKLSTRLLQQHVQTIIFARSRQSVELMLSYLQQSIQQSANPQASILRTPTPALRAYRGGYLPSVRREIERGLREGQVQGVVATNALELGIDIGRMGASVMVGYPGSVAATWQQAGRAGRTSEASLALLVVSAAPLDQYLAHQPAWFFERSPEHGLVNPDNLIILLHHLRCAAFELPFQKDESFGQVEGARVKEFLDFLSAEGVVHESNQKYFWMSEKYPADAVSLRSASPIRVVVQAHPTADPNDPISAALPQSLGTVDLHSAYWMLHPQAIYLHEGQSYFVDALDLTQHVAHVRPVQLDYYTDAIQEVTIALSEQFTSAPVWGAQKGYGEVQVSTQVTGFRKLKWFTHENLGMGEVTLPPTELLTTGYWLSLNAETVEQLRAAGLWRNDQNDYGPDWQRLRIQVRERDNFCCQQCGMSEMGKQHHVHHKVPFRRFPDAALANQLSNLITLCPSCHQKVETTVRMRSGLAGLSHVLGHMAPLLVMCDRGDLGVHSDPKSPLTDGQPTVVIYDQAPAGIGLSERLYELHAELLARAQALVASCDCANGCPSCVGPAGEQGEGGKTETLALLKLLVETVV